ncbi:bacteriocin immunity protein [Pseudomonas sp. PK-RTE-24]
MIRKRTKQSIADYTESEFICFVKNIRAVNRSGSDKELGRLLAEFRALTGHPAGTDLIYYPEPGADTTSAGIARTVMAWREANRLPGFKT